MLICHFFSGNNRQNLSHSFMVHIIQSISHSIWIIRSNVCVSTAFTHTQTKSLYVSLLWIVLCRMPTNHHRWWCSHRRAHPIHHFDQISQERWSNCEIHRSGELNVDDEEEKEKKICETNWIHLRDETRQDKSRQDTLLNHANFGYSKWTSNRRSSYRNGVRDTHEIKTGNTMFFFLLFATM